MYKNELLLVYQAENHAKSKKKIYSKEKAAEYYKQNKEAIKKVKRAL